MHEYESIDREKKFSKIFLFKKLHVTESKKIFGFYEFVSKNTLSKYVISDMLSTFMCVPRQVLCSVGARFSSLYPHNSQNSHFWSFFKSQIFKKWPKVWILTVVWVQTQKSGSDRTQNVPWHTNKCTQHVRYRVFWYRIFGHQLVKFEYFFRFRYV